MQARPVETSSERCLLEALIAGPRAGLTRAELQERTGLSAATLVTHLRKKSEGAGAGAGRLSNLVDVLEGDEARDRYRLRRDVASLLAIQLGRREVCVGIGDALGDVLLHPQSGKRWEEIDATINVDAEPSRAMDRAADMAQKIVREASECGLADPERLAGIGVAVTGAIEPQTGMFRPGRLVIDWEGRRVETELQRRLKRRGINCQMVIDKDCNHCAAAFGRSVAGAAVQNFVFVRWSYGVGAGLMLGGRSHRGVHGSAGAIGHSPIVRVMDKENKDRSPSRVWSPLFQVRCSRCEKQDCLEAMIGVNRLRRVVAEYRGLDPALEAEWPTLAQIQSEALADEESTEGEVLRAAAKRLGNALGAVANLLNPQLIVIGGEFGSDHSDLLIDRVREGLRDVSTAPAYRDVDVQFSDLGTIDGAIAALITSGTLSSFLLS